MSDSESPMQTHLQGRRYIFSTILSFLNECDGTSTLITNKTWARLVLPIYCIPIRLLTNTKDTEGENPQKRHKFIVVPVQDPSILLDRLNTVRLGKRLMLESRRGKVEGQYPKCMTTDEIAWHEWNQSTAPDDNNISLSPGSRWPVTLELLRYRRPAPQSNLTLKQPYQKRPDILPGITLLASYPRSGNTLLRNLLERTLNVVTGSDTRPDRTLSRALALQHNLVGEGIASPFITPIVKTHYPERKGFKAFNASRVIILVRNPYDAIDSYWNMCCTNTHTETVVDDIYELYAEKFRGLARSEIRTWMDFMKFWLVDNEIEERTRLPTLIVRYEDLILQTKSVMEEVMKFLLYGENIDGKSLHPFWKWRVQYSLGLNQNANSHTSLHYMSKTDVVRNDNVDTDTISLGSYKPRPISASSAKLVPNSHEDSKSQYLIKREQNENFSKASTISCIGKSLKKNRYSDDTIRYIHDVANEEIIGNGDSSTTLLSLFGYDILNHHFPLNFARNNGDYLPSLLRGDPECSVVKVNAGREIRPVNDPYGRAMTNWRKGKTDEDRNPFLTLTSNSNI